MASAESHCSDRLITPTYLPRQNYKIGVKKARELRKKRHLVRV